MRVRHKRTGKIYEAFIQCTKPGRTSYLLKLDFMNGASSLGTLLDIGYKVTYVSPTMGNVTSETDLGKYRWISGETVDLMPEIASNQDAKYLLTND